MNKENKEKVVEEKEEVKVESKPEITKEKNEGKNYFLGILVSLLTGLFVGFIVGILFAPKPGKEIRKDIKDKGEEFVKKSKKGVIDTIEKTKDFTEKSKSKFEKVKEAIIPKKTERKEEKPKE
ncbi:hypothetical protein ES703_19892 [subsurface metagenome]